MAEAGKEEKRLAEMRGEYHDKRSHKHSYNANSGVGIIIGKETSTSAYRTSTATHVPKIPPERNTPVTRIGLHRLPRWKQTSSWRGLWRLSRYMGVSTQNLLGTVTAP